MSEVPSEGLTLETRSHWSVLSYIRAPRQRLYAHLTSQRSSRFSPTTRSQRGSFRRPPAAQRMVAPGD
jgi:hypothetical protein